MSRFLRIVLVACLLAGVACERRRTPAPIPAEMRAAFETYLRDHDTHHHQYITMLFEKHDVVFLGEVHYIEHDVRLVKKLCKPLYEMGVRVLATEFARREDQGRIDSLLALPAWDEGLARAIQFDQSVEWGYREYVDIFRSAWELNHSLPEGAPRFRVLGLNDSPDWSFVRTAADRDDPAIMAKVWRGGGEHEWAKVVLDAVADGNKVLVYSGIHHAFTRYQQPVVQNGKFIRFDDSRMGNYVYRAIGNRAVTIFLHAPWPGPRGYDDKASHPANGAIDMYMFTRREGPHSRGFDLVGTPLGEIRPRNCVYMHGYADFKLSDFCDGWLYEKPISDYSGVKAIADWINEGNIEEARRRTPNLAAREYSIHEFNDMIARTADMRRHFSRLR